MKRNPRIGSDFDDFLQEEGILAAAHAVAAKRFVEPSLGGAATTIIATTDNLESPCPSG